MKHAHFILLFLIGTLLVACSASKQKVTNTTPHRPNILVLLADDLGYGELGCYGQKMIATPTLDKMARQGMRFTNFYAGAPVCSPSRAVLMTGIDGAHNTIRGNNGYVPEHQHYDRIALKKSDTTLGEMMQKAGYHTGFIGKWHLEHPNDLSTWAFARGFDYAVQEQWAGKHGGIPYDEQMHWINAKDDSIYYNEKEWNCKDEFRTNLAFEYLDKKRDKQKPFFLFMSYRAPHAHERYIHNKAIYADRGWPEIERRHAAKITLLDQQIGRLLKKLEEMGELENTLILFTSDNGPTGELGHNYEFFNSNGDLQGHKRDTYEGGIRVPTIAYWKGKIKEQSVSDYIGSGQDFMQTIAEAVGTTAPKQANGVSFLPVLLHQTPHKREFINWEFQKNGNKASSFRQAVRIGKYKGVRYGIRAPTELYDLSVDIAEANNIALQHPELIAKMEDIFLKQRSESSNYPYGGAGVK